MNKRPIAVICVFFISGIILARYLPGSVGFRHLFTAVSIFIPASFMFSRYEKLSNALLFLSIIFFAALLYLNSNLFQANHISHVLGEEKLKTDIVGIIKSPALTRKPSLPKKRNDFNYRAYIERQNILALTNTKENNITILSHNYKSNPILRYAYLIREKLKNQFLEKMPLESGAFLRAILLGDRSELPKDIQESFKNSGTMHILPTQCREKYSYPLKSHFTL